MVTGSTAVVYNHFFFAFLGIQTKNRQGRMYDRFLSAYLVMNANAVSSPAHINAYVYFLNLPMNVTQQVYTVIYFRMSQKKKLAVYKHQVGYWKR